MPEPNELLVVLLEQLKKTVSDGINILSGFDRVEFWLCDIVKNKKNRNETSKKKSNTFTTLERRTLREYISCLKGDVKHELAGFVDDLKCFLKATRTEFFLVILNVRVTGVTQLSCGVRNRYSRAFNCGFFMVH